MSVVIALVQPALLIAMAIPLALAGVTAALYGALFLIRSAKERGQRSAGETGRAFDLKTAVGFALLLGLVLMLSAGLNAFLGNAGLLVGAAVSGFADAHATAASAASLFAAGKIAIDQAIFPILLGLTTNTVTKAIVAFSSGGKAYALQIVPGLIAMILVVWLGTWFFC